MRTTRFLAIAAALALLLAACAEPAFAQRGGGRGGGRGGATLDEATILSDFDKIVELIWTNDEEDAWDAARSDEDKQAFVTSFWQRRDPTPGTPDNEYREQWMARASYAAQRFSGEGIPGYETDRGKFYLIFGPEALVAEERKQVSGSAQAGFGAERQGAGTSTNIIWTIDPSQNSFLEGKDEVTFAQYVRSFSKITGGIDYSEEAFLAGAAINAYFEARRANPTAAGPRAADPAAAGTAAATPAAAVASGPASADRKAMQQLLQNGVTRQDFALKQSMGYIPAQQGNTFAIFNFELGKAGLTFETAGAPGAAALLAFGVLMMNEAETGEERFVHEMQVPFTVDPGDGDAEETGTHSFGLTLAPGTYRLAWGVMDNASERIATTNYAFEVPDFSVGTLAIPSVLAANRMEQQTDQIDVNTIYQGSRVGNLALATDIDNVFGRNDNLLILYFIQGAGIDAATQQAKLEVDHRILFADTDESIARLQTQTLPFYAVQQEIPLGQIEQLEAGRDYKIEINVKDLVTGNELVHTVPFSVAGGDQED